jgi:ribosomal protein S18 acetylase RimI-like enzyme
MPAAEPFTIRAAAERDLDALVEYETVIAQVSFGDQAVVDPQVHRGKLEKALIRDPDSLFVAVDPDDRPIGWLWLASNTNFLTQDRYATLRSLAVTPGPWSEEVGEALLRRGLRFAREHGLTQLTGKVHVDNYGMRMLYRRVGLEPTHLTMVGTVDPADDPEADAGPGAGVAAP